MSTETDNRFYREPTLDVILCLTTFEAKALRNQLRGLTEPMPIVGRVLDLIATEQERIGAPASRPHNEPCPFCGEDEALRLHSSGRHAVTCGICFTEGPSAETPQAAIEGWNTRLKPE